MWASGSVRWLSAFGALLAALCTGCGDKDRSPADAGSGPSDAGAMCEVEAPAVIQPVWMAGGDGTRAEVGKFGKADAIFVHASGLLLVGDEHADYQELKLFDLDSDDPAAMADELTAIADIGADPGPAGNGPLEFSGISGMAQHPDTGELFIVEQLNGRIQVVRLTAAPKQAPHLEFVEFLGAFAADRDNPADGEFVRPQAARFDSMGRLYISDDAKGRAETARRDIQIFTRDFEFITKFGDASYGAPGEDGNLAEPENFVLDEVRNRIYVTDEETREIVVFTFDDHTFVERFGGFEGIPNGVDIDGNGVIYVMDEGAGQVILYDPDTLSEIYRFGASSEKEDLTPGMFNSPDTLLIDRSRDLLVITDQGHKRAQGFSLSDIQRRACLPLNRRLVLTSPPRAVSGDTITMRLEVFVGDRIDRSIFSATATLAGNDVPIVNGVGSVTLPVTATGSTTFTARVDELVATRTVDLLDAPAERQLTGTLGPGDLTWSPADGVILLSGTIVVPADETLIIEAGTLVKLAGNANLNVLGDFEAIGTELAPIYFFAANPADAWGTLAHTGEGKTARYEHVFITGGGDAPAIDHCCGPALFIENGALRMTHSLIVDGPEKGLHTRRADVEISRTQFARLAMGAELRLDRAIIKDCHFFEIRGGNDNDGIYFSGGGDYLVSGTVVAHGDDDGIDAEYATVDLIDFVVYDWADKAVSLTGRDPLLEDCLLLDSRIGIEIKDYNAGAATRPRIERCTIAGHSDVGLNLRQRDTEQPDLTPTLHEVIIWDVPTSVSSDYDLADITIDYSDVQQPVGTSGVGNLSADPKFVNPGALDYRLGPDSPAATAGETGGAIGWPGFR